MVQVLGALTPPDRFDLQGRGVPDTSLQGNAQDQSSSTAKQQRKTARLDRRRPGSLGESTSNRKQKKWIMKLIVVTTMLLIDHLVFPTWDLDPKSETHLGWGTAVVPSYSNMAYSMQLYACIIFIYEPGANTYNLNGSFAFRVCRFCIQAMHRIRN